MSELHVLTVTKKPVTVQAVRFDGTAATGQAILKWMQSFSPVHSGHFRAPVGMATGALFIPSPEGVMCANAGDYVIRGLSGHFYPCDPDTFAKTYEVII